MYTSILYLHATHTTLPFESIHQSINQSSRPRACRLGQPRRQRLHQRGRLLFVGLAEADGGRGQGGAADIFQRRERAGGAIAALRVVWEREAWRSIQVGLNLRNRR